jgi:hypothetical protein
MSRKERASEHGLREEVLNVKLAELLSRTGLLSIPESIIKEGTGKRLPDVAIGDYWGVRVVLEGKIADKANVRGALEKDCFGRIEEGIAALAIGIVYPTELRHSDWAALEQNMRNTMFQVKIFTEAGGGEWVDSNLEGLSAILRRAYESLVHEDVVNGAVEELRQSIEAASATLSGSPGTAQRLRVLLMVPRAEEADEKNE